MVGRENPLNPPKYVRPPISGWLTLRHGLVREWAMIPTIAALWDLPSRLNLQGEKASTLSIASMSCRDSKGPAKEVSRGAVCWMVRWM